MNGHKTSKKLFFLVTFWSVFARFFRELNMNMKQNVTAWIARNSIKQIWLTQPGRKKGSLIFDYTFLLINKWENTKIQRVLAGCCEWSENSAKKVATKLASLITEIYSYLPHLQSAMKKMIDGTNESEGRANFTVKSNVCKWNCFACV